MFWSLQQCPVWGEASHWGPYLHTGGRSGGGADEQWVRPGEGTQGPAASWLPADRAVSTTVKPFQGWELQEPAGETGELEGRARKERGGGTGGEREKSGGRARWGRQREGREHWSWVYFLSQVKDLRERIEEAESMGVRKMKAQLSAMDSRVHSLEEQLDVATK